MTPLPKIRKERQRRSSLKTKIAYIIPTLTLGGAEKQQVNILNSMDTDAFDITLFILKSDITQLHLITNPHIKVKIYHIDSYMHLIAIVRFVKEVRFYKPDIIHSQMYNANIIARLLKLFLPSTKIINHYHGLSRWLTPTKLYLDRATSFLCDRFIVVSKQSYDLRLTREKYPKDKMLLMYNSVNLPQPHLLQSSHTTKNSKPLVVGVASRLIPLKNIQAAIYMIGVLRKEGIDIILHIAGKGSEKESLIQYSKELHIQDYVIFLGFISKMEQFYASIDLFCITSTIEDLPLTIFEAMMYGKPVISTDVGGISEVLQEQNCTLLLNDFFDPDALQKIKKFITHYDRALCSQTLHNYAQKHFSNERYCQQLQQLYLELSTP